MLLNIHIFRHKGFNGLQISFYGVGVWITVGPFTLMIRREDSNHRGKAEFSAGFGWSIGAPYMEIGKTSFDLKNGVLVQERM